MYKPLTTLGGALDQKTIDAINAALGASPSLLSGTADAIDPHTAANYIVTKAGVDAMTLAAPTSGDDDNLIIVIGSNTGYAHTLTATGLLHSGAAGTDVATFAAFAGAGLALRAYQGKWNVLWSNGITFS
jgi:hypothetical protein